LNLARQLTGNHWESALALMTLQILDPQPDVSDIQGFPLVRFWGLLEYLQADAESGVIYLKCRRATAKRLAAGGHKENRPHKRDEDLLTLRIEKDRQKNESTCKLLPQGEHDPFVCLGQINIPEDHFLLDRPLKRRLIINRV
jgi:hypothetical protein